MVNWLNDYSLSQQGSLGPFPKHLPSGNAGLKLELTFCEEPEIFSCDRQEVKKKSYAQKVTVSGVRRPDFYLKCVM